MIPCLAFHNDHSQTDGDLTLPRSPENKGRWPNIALILGQRRKRWSNFKATLGQRLVFAVTSIHMDEWTKKIDQILRIANENVL